MPDAGAGSPRIDQVFGRLTPAFQPTGRRGPIGQCARQAAPARVANGQCPAPARRLLATSDAIPVAARGRVR